MGNRYSLCIVLAIDTVYVLFIADLAINGNRLVAEIQALHKMFEAVIFVDDDSRADLLCKDLNLIMRTRRDFKPKLCFPVRGEGKCLRTSLL